MRDIAFTILLAGLLPLCFLRPAVGVMAWCWISFMNPHRLMWGFATHFPVAVLVGGATLLGLLLAKDRKPIPGRPELVLMGLLAMHYTLTSVFAMVPEFAWNKWRETMKILLMTFVAPMVIYNRDRVRALLLVIALSIGYYGIKGGIWSLLHGGANRVRGPEMSFIADNNALALALVMVIPIMIALGRAETQRWRRQALIAAAVISVIATLFTYSRGGMVGLIIVIAVLLAQSRQKTLAALAVAAGISFVLWFAPAQLFQRAETIRTYEEDPSAMLRLQAWSVSLNIALERPVVGGGFKIEWLPDAIWMSYADRKYDQWGSTARSPHSIYFGTLGEHGFLGLAIYVALLLAALRSLQKIKHACAGRPPRDDWIAIYASGLQAGMIGFAVSGAFQPLPNFDLYFMYIALVAILQRELREVQKSEVDSPVQAAVAARAGSAPLDVVHSPAGSKPAGRAYARVAPPASRNAES